MPLGLRWRASDSRRPSSVWSSGGSSSPRASPCRSSSASSVAIASAMISLAIRVIVQVRVTTRVRVQLRAIDRHDPGLHQPRLRAQSEHRGEQVTERPLVAADEPRDRGVIRNQIGRDHPQNFIDCDREQGFSLPPDVREWLPEDHLAWFVIQAVDQLDLGAFYRAYREDGHGRAAYDPRMVGLVLYAYATGERSSRGIERHCRQDVAYRGSGGASAIASLRRQDLRAPLKRVTGG